MENKSKNTFINFLLLIIIIIGKFGCMDFITFIAFKAMLYIQEIDLIFSQNIISVYKFQTRF